jgi:membrane-bound serine protease (ClpP class)
MDHLFWSAILLLVGLLLVVGEVFVPSGGLLGFLAVAAVLASVTMAFFSSGVQTGLLFLTVAVVAVPVTLSLAFRWWPKTPMGKRLLLEPRRGDEVLPDSPQRRRLRDLVGKVGKANTVMLPSGGVTIGGHSIDAVSEGMAIDAGQRVRVVDVRGNRVVVRPVVDDESDARTTGDILSQPIESLGIDPFDDRDAV